MKTETATLSYKIKKESKILKYMLNLLNYVLKVFIATSIVFLFLSIFIYNLQIQHHSSNGNLTDFTNIVQVDELVSNLHAYFLEN